MVVVGGADEAVVADIHQLPQVLDGGNDLIDVLLGSDACIGCLVLDLLAMLVGSGQEHDVIALHPLEAGQRVAGHGGVAVADVQLIAGVVNGSGNVECFVLTHGSVSSFLLRQQKAPVPCRKLRPRTRALLSWYHLGSPGLCRQSLARWHINNVPARRGNGRTRRRLEKKTPLRPRGSETIFHSARPARFHPPGFLSGADGVYSSRQSRFAVWMQRGRTFPLHLLPIIRKNSEFVN